MVKRFGAVCAVVLLLPAGAVYASDSVLILKSGNMPVINETAEAFRSAWRGNVDVHTVKSPSETINAGYYTAAVAIGSKASLVLKSNHEESIPALYGLVLSPEEIGLFSNNFIGIAPAPDFDNMLNELKSRSGPVRTLGVIYSSRSEYLLEALNKAGAGHDIEIAAYRISGRQEVSLALKKFKNIDLFYLMPDPLLLNEDEMVRILNFFNALYVPVVAAHRIALMFGATYAYVLDPSDIGKGLAEETNHALKDNTYKPKIIYLKGRLYRK